MGALLNIAIEAATKAKGEGDTPEKAELRRLVPLFTTYCGFSRKIRRTLFKSPWIIPDNALMFYRGKVTIRPLLAVARPDLTESGPTCCSY
jgi:hypothetical protein